MTGEPANGHAGGQQSAQQRRWLTRGVAGAGVGQFLQRLRARACHRGTADVPDLCPACLGGCPRANRGDSRRVDRVTKLAGGALADDPRRRARVASGGYLGTAVATAAIGLATAVWQVGVLRAIAWASLLASLARKGAYGRAFGVERAGDNLGAVAGPLLASLLVTVVGVRHAIFFSVIPGLFTAAAITLAAREARRLHASPGARQRARLNLGALRDAGRPAPWSRWSRSSSATSPPPC